MSPIITGFFVFYQGLNKTLFSLRNNLDWNFDDFAVALDYWQSDISNNVVYDVSSRYWNYYFSVTTVLVSSILVSSENLKLLDDDWKSNHCFSPRIRILVVQKFQNLLLLLIYLGIQSHLWPLLQASFPELQASFLLPRLQSKGFRLPGTFVIITILSGPCDWLFMVQKNQDVFLNMESSQFSNPGSPITTNLMSSFKIST